MKKMAHSNFYPLSIKPFAGQYVVIETYRTENNRQQRAMHRAKYDQNGGFIISPLLGGSLQLKSGEKVIRWKKCQWPSLS